jgi:hypothetical protein
VRSPLLELATLLLKLLLLTLKLCLSLLIASLLILQRIADYCAAGRSNRTAYRGTDTRYSNRAADYRSGAGADDAAGQCAFFSSCERLSRTS